MMDLEYKAKTRGTLEELTCIHTHKTAASLQFAVVAGRILGGANTVEVKAQDFFALDIGVVFEV